jgi:PAS domain S-box-containing protein
MDSVPDLIAILDTRHRIVRANPPMAQRLGVTAEQCVGLHCYESVHGLPEPPEFCPHTLTVRDGREHVAEVHEEGLGGDFLVSTTPLQDEQGVLIGTVHVARDISERKQMEEELRRSRDELELRVRERNPELRVSNKALMEYAAKLERLNEELQDFAFVASHDLQEPLRKIQTFCDMVLKRCSPVLDRTGQEYLDRVMSSATRMRELLQGLLQFSRVATIPRPFKEIDPGKLARQAADFYEEDLRKSGGLVEIEGMPHIEADEDQMVRLFENLNG